MTDHKSLWDALDDAWGDWPGDCIVEGCELIGGGACPEQYDAYFKGEHIGYLRLRHGNFRAETPQAKVVYRANPKGDGIFDSDEREGYLYMAVLALLSEYRDAQDNKND